MVQLLLRKEVQSVIAAYALFQILYQLVAISLLVFEIQIESWIEEVNFYLFISLAVSNFAVLMTLGVYLNYVRKSDIKHKEVYDASYRLIESKFEENSRARTITEVREIATLYSDCTCEVSRLISLKASYGGINLFPITVLADAGAPNVGDLSDIGFAVETDSENHVTAYVCSPVKEKSKSIFIIIYPEVKTGSSITLKISYKWQKFAYDLKTKKQTSFLYNYKGKFGEDSTISFSFNIHQSFEDYTSLFDDEKLQNSIQNIKHGEFNKHYFKIVNPEKCTYKYSIKAPSRRP